MQAIEMIIKPANHLGPPSGCWFTPGKNLEKYQDAKKMKIKPGLYGYGPSHEKYFPSLLSFT
jgi:hypothetical protein